MLINAKRAAGRLLFWYSYLMKKYYITGVPGIGKTTIMKELQRLEFAAFDVDYVPGLCHWMHVETKEPVEFIPGASEEWHKAHAWLCDVGKLKELMDKQRTERLFVCGLTKNQEEYYELFDAVVLLHADQRIFIERMAGRDSEHFGHNEDDRMSVLEWHKRFEEEALRAGALAIDSSQPVEETVSEILFKLGIQESNLKVSS